MTAVLLTAAATRADSVRWGGTVGGLEISAVKSGFNDGFGRDGWSAQDAHEFAAWARRYAAALPPGVSVKMEVSDDVITVSLLAPIQQSLGELEGSVQDERLFSRVLGEIGNALGASLILPPELPAAPLYTIELLSTPSAAVAQRFATAIDARSISPEHQLYYSACQPCFVPEARVFTTGALHQVMIGIFDDPELAQRSLAELGHSYRLRGRVRTLPSAE